MYEYPRCCFDFFRLSSSDEKRRKRTKKDGKRRKKTKKDEIRRKCIFFLSQVLFSTEMILEPFSKVWRDHCRLSLQPGTCHTCLMSLDLAESPTCTKALGKYTTVWSHITKGRSYGWMGDPSISHGEQLDIFRNEEAPPPRGYSDRILRFWD